MLQSVSFTIRRIIILPDDEEEEVFSTCSMKLEHQKWQNTLTVLQQHAFQFVNINMRSIEKLCFVNTLFIISTKLQI